MNNRISNTIKKYNMLSQNDTVVVGVSGGADSMLLLHYLIHIKDSMNLHLIAAHIEHGIRGQESVDDAAFVKDFCEGNGIAFHQLSIDAVGEAHNHSMGVEEYSRKKRYEFFNSISCDKIATAHNLSDNIETLLMRLARGTGLKGVCGIPPVRGKIIRPLIEINSDDIRNYCDTNHIAYRVDSTNCSDDYSRNYVRNQLVPAFQKQYPEFESAVSKFIADATEDYNFINACAEDCYNEICIDSQLLKSRLINCDIALQKRIILKYFSGFGIHLDRLHLNEVIKLICRNGKCQIRENHFAVSNGKYLRYACFGSDNACDNIEFKFVTKILNIGEFIKDNVDFYCDYDKIVGEITVRSKQSGDTISPANRNCTKPLKKFFNELRIPIEKRNNIPVICDSDGIIGIAGYAINERVKTDKNTKRVLIIQFPLED
ncbi:MAG: tRNA lysidine(34) synthetase TilS [Clostridium sp.]|nr:tRNA lysidine(34) synthetase TilS [Clostridium sp.]